MEFNLKLQKLRKEKNLTQEELAKALYVSRTAISKWESGRGYPSIDSLKDIANFFHITVDELLSGKELITLAEQDNKNSKNRFCDLVFALMDISAILLLFLPFFAEREQNFVKESSLIFLSGFSPVLKTCYFALVIGIVLFGVFTLIIQNENDRIWFRNKQIISLVLNVLGILLFILGLQPYAAIYLFVFLLMKVLILAKKQ